MAYELSPLSVPYLAALVVTVALWGRLWRHRGRRAAQGFLLDVTGVVLLAAVVALKLSATDLGTKTFWWNWRFLAVSCMAIGYMVMAIQYTDNEHLLTRPVVGGLVAFVAATQVAVWTNDVHGLFYTAGTLQDGVVVPLLGTYDGLLVPAFGPLYWAYAAPLVGCIAVGVTLLVGRFRAQAGVRTQTAVLVGTIALVMVGTVLWWLRIVPLDTLALTSAVKVVGFYLAVDRLQLLDRLPVAQATVLRNMQDAVLVVDGTGRVVEVNPAAERLFSDRTVLDERLGAVLGVEGLPAIDGTGGGEETIASREITLDRDGETGYYDMTLSRFPDGTGAVAVLHDITERRNREQEITILNRIVRHDIRNEMNVLHGRGRLLEAHLDDAAEADYRLVMESAQHVIEITDTVRELMESITAGGSMTVEPVGLAAMLRSEVAKARSNFPEATITVDGCPDVSVRANEMLSSVFTNLLNNAVIHNPSPEPSVWVDATVDGDVVKIAVADDGEGVPPDQREEIFGRGAKGLESEGTGVGLYLVDTLVSEYGGDVWVEDADQGGAAFVVELRLAGTATGGAAGDEDPGARDDEAVDPAAADR